MAKKASDGIKVDLPENRYKTRVDLTQAIAQLGEIKRERDRVKSEVDDQISQLTTQLQTDLTPLDVKIQHIVSGIKLYVDKNKDELFPDPEYKTCKLPTGELKLRKVPASVKTRASAKLFEKILSENGLLEKFNALTSKLNGLFLRIKLELNKDQILSEPLRASKKIGIELNEETERLYITPSEIDAEIEAVGDAA
ncbi:host-nuclease inhibitor Gam family protein (plasmid) [Leptospira weilii]|uniref:host-nuclease inhibitor Gam family protein n=1 Tax=Leptospira weilii TaxID=28184 RepID=UPI001EF2B0CD|nr:host-nuclease inhibitor Gam family protein [Leptospira weilii]ULH29031.1 host-nuclease inhibitor Gam family protein [Leptospira weilii]UPY79916.1 host-nuclease inhibitor Gam family protein [Leptospira weilii]UPY80322.1 host-nuclease inhibitor Gam family protein [Leptospira weilii]UPY80346.1 host-nuclease inhibitor Gam family protein [Leptospira weilii]UPY80836.1 host-nuclease inhibitor Gam family protein [Leptospira weilii]